MRSLFAGLFDDAALFPPGDAPMATAVPAHRDLRARLGDLVGPFVVPAARLDELSVHPDDGDRFPGSLIAGAGDLPTAVAGVAGDPGDGRRGVARRDRSGHRGDRRAHLAGRPRRSRARAVFTSFGTCSVLEPVDDLVALGLLPAPERIPA